jgi:hypothetical protein
VFRMCSLSPLVCLLLLIDCVSPVFSVLSLPISCFGQSLCSSAFGSSYKLTYIQGKYNVMAACVN